ncbi:MAG: phosphate ABC transporter permease PstA [Lentisphaeria bacterium]|nr:phosphate ABC transporter permease PstA [Lentisphaeria bacterium]
MAEKTKIKGESYIWLNAMGLSLGIIMIVFLLGLIVKEGLTVFWPKKVYQIETTDNQTIVGERVSIGTKINTEIIDASADRKVREWYIYQGNKDLTGQSFRYLEESKVKSTSFPEAFIRMERMEYGNAIALPSKIVLDGKEEILASDEKFQEVLESTIEKTDALRDQIHEFEKVEIGKVNSEIEEIRLEILEDETLQENYADELKDLEQQYEKLRLEASEMHEQLEKDQFFYTVPGYQEKSVTFGEIVRFYYPNQLSLGGRFVQFIDNIIYFIKEKPREANTEGGIFPALFGTFVMTVLMSLLVTPFGVIAAVFMHEYARPEPVVRVLRIAINNLAGVPSIVFGVFGLGFFVYFIGQSIDDIFNLPPPTFGTGGLMWASLTLALLTLPVVIVSTEESLNAVPKGIREASLACGSTKWQMIWRILIPASLPGIITGMILAMARGAGEVAPLMLVGVVKLAPDLPLNTTYPFIHLDQKFMHLGFHIYDLGFQSPDSEAAKPMVFATTLLLITLVITLNLFGIIVRNKIRNKYASSAF